MRSIFHTRNSFTWNSMRLNINVCMAKNNYVGCNFQNFFSNSFESCMVNNCKVSKATWKIQGISKNLKLVSVISIHRKKSDKFLKFFETENVPRKMSAIDFLLKILYNYYINLKHFRIRWTDDFCVESCFEFGNVK